MFKLSILSMILLLCSQAHARVLIFTYAYNRPDFIEIQHKTLKRFFLDDYEFVVFNDARAEEHEQLIKTTCAKLNIRCIRIPQEIHDQPYLERLPGEGRQSPTVRNCNVVQYSLNTLGFDHNDIVILFDSDLFLVKPFSVREFLKEYDLGGALSGNGHVNFLWHGLAFLDMRTMPNKRTLNFNCGRVDGKPIDAGGYSYYYLKNNPQLKTHYIYSTFSGNLLCDSCRSTDQPLCSHNAKKLAAEGFDANQIKFLQAASNVEFFHRNSFLHYRGGTNWDNKKAIYHEMKTDALNAYLTAILS